MDKKIDYGTLNESIKKVNELIRNKNFEEAKKTLNDYIKKSKKLYSNKDGVNYSFKNITEFYLFVNNFKVDKKVYWINLMCDEAYRLLGYIAVEEKEYDKALAYLKESLKYNPINIETFYELVETYKMMNNLDKMKETLDGLYDYIYDETSLSRYYRNLGFYFIEKEQYDLAFSLYLISLEYEYSQFALSEMVYIRKKLDKPDFVIEKEDAVKIITDNDIKIGVLDKTLSLLKNLSKEKGLKEKNPNYIEKLKRSINTLSKKIK